MVACASLLPHGSDGEQVQTTAVHVKAHIRSQIQAGHRKSPASLGGSLAGPIMWLAPFFPHAPGMACVTTWCLCSRSTCTEGLFC